MALCVCVCVCVGVGGWVGVGVSGDHGDAEEVVGPPGEDE